MNLAIEVLKYIHGTGKEGTDSDRVIKRFPNRPPEKIIEAIESNCGPQPGTGRIVWP